MYLSHLTLVDYRSYEAAEFEFTPGVNILVGPNGHGKTNAMEAIGYLATMNSHRVVGDAALIRRGAQTAVIRAQLHAGTHEHKLEVQIIPGRVNRASHQNIARRPRDLIGITRTVLFAPEDLQLVRGEPDLRRRFIDDLLQVIAPRFAGVKADYDKVLKQRNALLKSSIGRENRRLQGAVRRKSIEVNDALSAMNSLENDGVETADMQAPAAAALSTLAVWDEQLVTLGAELTRARIHLIARLRPHFRAAYLRVSEDFEVPEGTEPAVEVGADIADAAVRNEGSQVSPAQIDYQPRAELPTIAPSDENPTGLPTQAQIRSALYDALATLRRQELERGVSLVGPHRDDVQLQLLDFPVKGYASHGETWSIVLALKLAAFALLREEANEWEGGDPILILDDVFAELDVGRRRRLAELVKDTEQVLITAAVDADLPAALAGAKYGIRRSEGISAIVSRPDLAADSVASAAPSESGGDS